MGLIFLAACAAPACAGVIQLDVRALFNADVVVNNGSGTLDPTQEAIDLGVIASGNFCFPTQSVAVALSGGVTPDGLPDDAVFPANAFHPAVHLWWDNRDDGLNARRNAAATDAFSIDVPPGRYVEAHLFATTGDGTSDMTVTLVYDDATTSSTSVVVGDWFDDPAVTADAYRLVDGRDRLQPGSGVGTAYLYEQSNDPAIFGFRFLADSTKNLVRIDVQRTDTTGVLDVFGAVAVTVPVAPDLYESTLAPGLLAPGNIVLRGVTSPIDRAPPVAQRLFYFVDDLAGYPALIFVEKGGTGLLITF